MCARICLHVRVSAWSTHAISTVPDKSQLSADACVTHNVAPPLIAHTVSHQYGQQRHQLIYSIQQNLRFHHSGSQYIFIDGMHLSPVTPMLTQAINTRIRYL